MFWMVVLLVVAAFNAELLRFENLERGMKPAAWFNACLLLVSAYWQAHLSYGWRAGFAAVLLAAALVHVTVQGLLWLVRSSLQPDSEKQINLYVRGDS